MLTLLPRRFSLAEAREVTAWTYPPPFDVYNVGPNAVPLFLDRGANDDGYYPALDLVGDIAGFCVFGAEARVAGQEPAAGTLDIGLGLRPDLTGHGFGAGLLEQACGLGEQLCAARVLRAAVAAFNARSLALCRRAGFEPVREFSGPGGRPFHELVRVERG